MSNLTIIVDDNAVYLDGGVLSDLDLTSVNIPANIHALQWKTNIGWIEFIDNPDGTKSANNEIINALPDWANSCIAIFERQVELNRIEAEEKIAAYNKAHGQYN
jgi:hypothetical protein